MLTWQCKYLFLCLHLLNIYIINDRSVCLENWKLSCSHWNKIGKRAKSWSVRKMKKTTKRTYNHDILHMRKHTHAYIRYKNAPIKSTCKKILMYNKSIADTPGGVDGLILGRSVYATWDAEGNQVSEIYFTCINCIS